MKKLQNCANIDRRTLLNKSPVQISECGEWLKANFFKGPETGAACSIAPSLSSRRMSNPKPTSKTFPSSDSLMLTEQHQQPACNAKSET